MKIAIMQPYLFPYLGYFQLLNYVDKFVILDDVNFTKGGWINRNRIIVNGEEFMFTVPIKDVSQNKLINECEISYDEDWSSRLVKTFEHSYRNSDYFLEGIRIAKAVFLLGINDLSEFLRNSITLITDYLEINTEMIISSSIYNNKHLKAQSRIIDICKREGADEYVNLPGGDRLYKREDFSKENINLRFIITGDIIYNQDSNLFFPNMSVIDVLMNCSRETVGGYLSKFNLYE